MILIFLFMLLVHSSANETKFVYNGFQGSINKLHLDGLASILPNGVLQITNSSQSLQHISHAFYPHPIFFKPNHLSFSTTFVFAMNRLARTKARDSGIIFAIASLIANFNKAIPLTSCLSPHHIFAVVLQASKVNINLNSLVPIDSVLGAYYLDKEGVNKTLVLNSGKPVQIWIDYNDTELLVNVTLAPFGHPKPSRCLLSRHINFSTAVLQNMYTGFSYCTNHVSSNNQYILGWSWNQNGKAEDLDPSKLPSLPRIRHKRHGILIGLIAVLVVLIMVVSAGWISWKKKFQELLEPWEKEYASQRFLYRDLYVATKGFRSSELLGVGGFGKVYKGVLPSTNVEVAVKRVSHNSKQGIREFVAEISSMRRLSHRNLVQLLGYCRKEGKLFLVYEHMANGSLDKFLFSQDKKLSLTWPLRLKIVEGVASALLYLHEGWEQVVLHRDVKASNVLLDAKMNAKLGDFGLARLYDHNNDPRTTHVVGTIGYIAPEVSRTQKPTTKADVYAFGMFLLEVGCGRRPIGIQRETGEEDFLSDRVYDCWKRGEILKASDPKMKGDYQEKEMELVLKLGLLCLHPKAKERPTMRQVVQFLDGSLTLPDLTSEYDIESHSWFWEGWRKTYSLTTSNGAETYGIMSSTNSVLQYGR
ncbi:L-type lectin-domain containing receptor kinase IV.1-like [Amaranthus tricolor]|uniref:L-type lectin-domain containing receptor kinase IV.1-like n=1 Tax=Amaranthus tricolor TaxID=29722 RepID=UPI002584ABAC|nr:L-type lectin-domain containing receptor kinase IV.1-like [Amaranthus tricolor]